MYERINQLVNLCQRGLSPFVCAQGVEEGIKDGLLTHLHLTKRSWSRLSRAQRCDHFVQPASTPHGVPHSFVAVVELSRRSCDRTRALTPRETCLKCILSLFGLSVGGAFDQMTSIIAISSTYQSNCGPTALNE